MILLPILRENCSPEALFMDRDAGGVLHIISLIVISTSTKIGSDGEALMESTDVRLNHPTCDFSSCDPVLALPEGRSVSQNKDENNLAIDLEMESQLSITSVVLTILVTILELGSSRRIERKETDLQTLATYLASLAGLGELSFSLNEDAVSTVCALRVDIADMSIHAAALIQARALEDSPEEDIMPPDMPLLDYIKSKIVSFRLTPDRASL